MVAKNLVLRAKKKHEKYGFTDAPMFYEGICFMKSDCHLPKQICFICIYESPLKMMRNAFYFILKAFFVHKIFNFLSWFFVHAEEKA